MMKKLTVLFAVLLLLTACGTSGAVKGEGSNNEEGKDSDVITIGIITPKTGNVAIYGITTEQGMMLAADEINANGGINGKKLVLKSEDDKGDATEAVNIYSKFVEEGVNAILGPVTSKPALAVAENSVADNIPIITPTGTMESITEGKPNVFRICFTDPMQGVLLANFASGTLNAKTAAILRNTSSDYSNGVADKFIEKAKADGIEIVADEGYGATDKDFKAQLTNIKSSNPELLLIPDYYENDVIIVKQAHDVGLNIPIIGPDGWDGVLGVVAKGEEQTLNNCYFTNHYSVKDTNPVVKSFVDNYRAKYNDEPSAFAALGYDAVHVYAKALENAKSLSYEDIIEALGQVELEGVTGNLKFGENNNPIKSAAIMKIENGEYVLDSYVKPE